MTGIIGENRLEIAGTEFARGMRAREREQARRHRGSGAARHLLQRGHALSRHPRDPLNGGRDLLLAFYSGSGGCSLLGELCAGPNDLAPSVTCRWDDGWAPWSESSCARSCLLTKSSGPCDASFFARAAFK
ncbi:MAG: hypothetical protein ABW346_02290 [Terrimicrobium sp.]